MNPEEYIHLIHQRAVEVQPHLYALVQDYKAMDMTPQQIQLELSIALINEGFRLRDLQLQGIIHE